MAKPCPAIMMAVSLLLSGNVAWGAVGQVDSPFYGEALYDFYQQKYFSSIIHLEKELDLDRLGPDTD